MQGIYKITNKKSNKAYIGMSINIFDRIDQHVTSLKNGIHPIKELQDDYNDIGCANFNFSILEKCTRGNMREREGYYIQEYDTYHNGYNRKEEPTELSVPSQWEIHHFLKKALIKAEEEVTCTGEIKIKYVDDRILKVMLPIFNDDIEKIRLKNEIYIVSNNYKEYKNVPYIYVEDELLV